MNKKAFTLMELLAVIIILGIIMLIAIPSVSSIIKSSKIRTLKINGKMYLTALEKYPAMHRLNPKKYDKLLTGEQSVTGNSDEISLNELVKASGEKPINGTVTFDENSKITKCQLIYPGYTLNCIDGDDSFDDFEIEENDFKKKVEDVKDSTVSDDPTKEDDTPTTNPPSDFVSANYTNYSVFKNTQDKTFTMLGYNATRLQSVCYDSANKTIKVWYDSSGRGLYYNQIINGTWGTSSNRDYSGYVIGGGAFGVFFTNIADISSFVYSTVDIYDCGDRTVTLYKANTDAFDNKYKEASTTSTESDNPLPKTFNDSGYKDKYSVFRNVEDNTYNLVGYNASGLQSVCYDSTNKQIKVWYDSYNCGLYVNKLTNNVWGERIIYQYSGYVVGGNEFGLLYTIVSNINSVLYSNVNIYDCADKNVTYYPTNTNSFDYVFK